MARKKSTPAPTSAPAAPAQDPASKVHQYRTKREIVDASGEVIPAGKYVMFEGDLPEELYEKVR